MSNTTDNKQEKAEKSDRPKTQYSWPGLFREFLENPPTASIFRLYILSFILWNKGAILYIFFGKADMADKLAIINWGKYVIGHDLFLQYHSMLYISFYIGPLLIVGFLWFVSESKRMNFKNKKVSLFNYIYNCKREC